MSANPLPAPHPDSREDQSPATPGRRPELRALFLAHVALFVAFNTVIAGINALVSPDQMWFPFVVWGWAMVLALHGSWTYPHRRIVRWHAGLYILLNAGLVAINISQGDPPWAIWTILSLGIILVAHWLFATRRVNLFQVHLVTTALATGVILLTPIVGNPDAMVSVVAPAVELWGLVLVHWLLRIRRWPLFLVHLTTYAVIMSALVIDNLLEEPGQWWVLYPLVIWGVVVLAHGILATIRVPATGRTIEETFLVHLRDRSSVAWPLWTLAFHGLVFLVAAIAMGVMEVIDGSERVWAFWPIGAWLALLTIHIGAVLVSARLFGAHLFAWIAGSLGMLAIDIGTEGGPWWPWPVIWWGVVVGLHAGLSLPRGVRLFGVHILGGAALTVAFILTNVLAGGGTWWWYPVGVILLTIALHLGLQFTQRMYSPASR